MDITDLSRSSQEEISLETAYPRMDRSLRMSSYDCLLKSAGLLGAVSHKSLEKIPFLRVPSYVRAPTEEIGLCY